MAERSYFCQYRTNGCAWNGPLNHLELHARECQYQNALVNCHMCGAQMQAKNLDEHHSAHCSKRHYRCHYCGEYEGPYEEVKEKHYPFCEGLSIPCCNPHCALGSIPRAEYADHAKSEYRDLQREVKGLQDELKRSEKEKGELKEKLRQERETVKSKIAEIDVLKEWDKEKDLELQKSKDEIASLKSELENQAELKALKKKVKDTESEKLELQKQLQQERKVTGADSAGQEQEKEREMELRKREDEIAALKLSEKKKVEELKDSKNEVAALKLLEKEKDMELKKSKEEIAALKMELDKVKQQQQQSQAQPLPQPPPQPVPQPVPQPAPQPAPQPVPQPVPEPNPPFPPQACINWVSRRRVATKMYGGNVEVIGDHVYYGGGSSSQADRESIVNKYDPTNDTWVCLPSLSRKKFTLVNFRQRLVAIGGVTQINSFSRNLSVWDDRTQQWKAMNAKMRATRMQCMAITYKGCIIVAGGKNVDTLKTIEFYNGQKWQSSPKRLPVPMHSASSAVLNGQWYLAGGETNQGPEKAVHYISLDAILSPQVQAVWGTLVPLSYERSTLVTFRNTLLAIGGIDVMNSDIVYKYSTDECKWVEIKKALPTSCRSVAAVQLNDNELIVVGGCGRMMTFDHTFRGTLAV